MKIISHFVVPTDLDTTWEALKDVPTVSRCVPGAQLHEEVAPGRYAGEMRTKFGAAVASFKGEAVSQFDHTAHVITLDAKGMDLRGRHPVKCKLTIALTEEEGTGTRGDVAAEFKFTGPLAAVAATGGKRITVQLISEFAANLAAHLQPRAHGVAAETVPKPEQVVDLKVGALAFRAWRNTWRMRWVRWTRLVRRRVRKVDASAHG